MSLDYHFKVEQESGSSMHSFFGFNGKIQYQNYLRELIMPGPNITDLPTGTAAVWRVSATILLLINLEDGKTAPLWKTWIWL